jgi:hypothetical protein
VLVFDAWRRGRRGERSINPALLVLPAVACFAAWQAYSTWRFDGEVPWTTAPSDLWQAPVVGVVEALPELFDQPAGEVAWDLAYLALCGAAVVAAAAALGRDRGPETLFCGAQAAVVVLLGEVFWIDHWSFTRVTAPLFASLLLAGVVVHSRSAVAIACAAAGLTVLIPAALNTGSTFEASAESSARPARQDRGARSLHLAAHVASGEVVVDDAAGLHRGVRGGRPDEAEPTPLQLLRKRRRLLGDRR